MRIKNYYSYLNKSIFEEKLFFLSIFFCASAPILSSIMLLGAITTNFKKFYIEIFSDKWNKFFLFTIFLVLISCIKQTFFLDTSNYGDWSISSTWIGLIRWTLMVIVFWNTQYFLKEKIQRELFSFSLICGSIPVLITGIGHYFFGWEGPWSFLNGFIVWYLHPKDNGFGLLGLFNNENYIAAWFTIILPFCFGRLFLKNESNISKLITIFISLLLIFSTIFTFSRSSLIAIFIVTLLSFSSSLYISFLFILGFLVAFYNFMDLDIVNSIQNINESVRFEIYSKAVKLISYNPIFGSGYESFPSLYFQNNGLSPDIQHPHSIILFLAFNYGIPFATVVILVITLFVAKSLKIIQKKKLLNNDISRSWIICFFVLILLNSNDIVYLDGRISVISWIILAGTKCIIEKEEKSNKI